MTKILAFAGSTRRDSLNKTLARLAADRARAAGAEVTFVDLRDYALPLYDGDLEEAAGIPAAAVRWKATLCAHDGFLIACPEYNSSITAVLKNAIDWASRPAPGEAPLVAFAGRVAGLLAASPGGLGGLRGLVHVRAILGNLGVHVVPAQLAIPQAHEVLGPDGKLVDPKWDRKIADVAVALVDATRRLRGAAGATAR